jgi:D-inositol-3-phosphate glycosyltransferase
MDSAGSVKRIALLALHSSPLASIGEGNAGGMNLYVRRLADELVRRGMLVDVFTRRTDRHTPDVVVSQAGARFVHLDAGPAEALPKHVLPLHIPALTSALEEYVSRKRAEYDVIHAHYWLSGMVALRSQPFLAAPLITMFHTLARAKQLHAGKADDSESALRADSERCLISSSDVVVGATRGELDLMQRLYGRTPREFVAIPPGVDLQRFRPHNKRESRQALGWPDSPTLLFVGRFDPMKGLDALLRGLSRVKSQLPRGTRLVVAGGDGRGGSTYRALASELGVSNLVEFCGLVPPDRLPMFYSAADLCVVPSVYESFGMAAVEAMACATPVVAFRVGALATTVIDGCSGILVEPQNIAALGGAIVHALTDCNLSELGRRARFHVQRFSWQRSVTATTALYTQVAEDRICVCNSAAGA